MSKLYSNVTKEFDWRGYVETHFNVKYTGTAEYRINCINCDDDKYKLYINVDKNLFNCFKCQFSSKKFDVFDFVSKTENITRLDAIKQLVREYAPITPLDFTDTQERESQSIIQDIKYLTGLPIGLMPMNIRTEMNSRFWDYLSNRGCTDKEIIALGARYSSHSIHPIYDSKGKKRGDIANRVVIPIYGGDHKLVSWQGRHIDPNVLKQDRFMTAPESELAKTVWPFVPPHTNHAIIVEGIFDALSVRRLSKTSSYATFSKKISTEQIRQLKSWGVTEITLFWDKRDAKKEMLLAIPDLLMYFDKVYVSNMDNIPAEIDCGDLLKDLEGVDKLVIALNDLVDTADSIDLAKWSVSF